MFSPPYRRDFGGKKHQEASLDTLLVQTEITKVSIFSNVCSCSKLYTHDPHERPIHVNYLTKSFWSKLNEDIMLYQQISC